MIRLRSLAPHLLLAPLLTLVVACGGSDEATDTTPAPVATDVATGGAAIDTLPPLETTAAGVDPTLPPAPVATVPVTPEEVCALLTATEVQEFARANGFTADDYTWSAPALSPSGAGCEMSFPTTGVIDLFPSMYASDDELLMRVADFLEPQLTQIPPDPFSGLGNLFQLGKIGLNFRKLGRQVATEAVEILTGAATPILNRWFESEELKATLATDAVIGNAASLRARTVPPSHIRSRPGGHCARNSSGHRCA